jgi:hypothetical protein
LNLIRVMPAKGQGRFSPSTSDRIGAQSFSRHGARG